MVDVAAHLTMMNMFQYLLKGFFMFTPSKSVPYFFKNSSEAVSARFIITIIIATEAALVTKIIMLRLVSIT